MCVCVCVCVSATCSLFANTYMRLHISLSSYSYVIHINSNTYFYTDRKSHYCGYLQRHSEIKYIREWKKIIHISLSFIQHLANLSVFYPAPLLGDYCRDMKAILHINPSKQGFNC